MRDLNPATKWALAAPNWITKTNTYVEVFNASIAAGRTFEQSQQYAKHCVMKMQTYWQHQFEEENGKK